MLDCQRVISIHGTMYGIQFTYLHEGLEVYSKCIGKYTNVTVILWDILSVSKNKLCFCKEIGRDEIFSPATKPHWIHFIDHVLLIFPTNYLSSPKDFFRLAIFGSRSTWYNTSFIAGGWCGQGVLPSFTLIFWGILPNKMRHSLMPSFKGDSRDPQGHGTPSLVSGTHTIPISLGSHSYGSGMGSLRMRGSHYWGSMKIPMTNE